MTTATAERPATPEAEILMVAAFQACNGCWDPILTVRDHQRVVQDIEAQVRSRRPTC